MANPTKFKPEFVELARNYCLLGATDVDLARFFGTTDRTIRTWKQQHPEFAEALEQAKEVADAQVVGALYTNALAGNVTAQIFWLKNRQPAKWRDKVDHEHAGKDGGAIQFQRVERRIIDPKSE
ncbi:terminase [Burkholderia sp. AU45274]|uniref:terminase n=1 Tax=Burkholderia sp. AU45274 TaxID=3059205 RepID=UPI0026517C40|nr:terminase [Burkholderia sp. AU45274]MDN7489500.1 terminase [Burkholderia sp. AU45274]